MTPEVVTMNPLGFVSLERHVAAGYVPGDPKSPNPPAFIFRREHPGHAWLVAGSPLTTDEVTWLEVVDGNFVHVPLVPYVVEADAAIMVGFAWQLAALALGRLARPIYSMQLALARPAEDLYPTTQKQQVRVHAGLAVRIR